MALNFPTSPALNEIYDRWQWNGDRWVAAPAPPATAYLPLHGGTMSGAILQPLAPATAAAVPNRAYVDEAIATQALYQGVWDAATNTPDLNQTATHRDGFMWLAVTPNPDLPFTITPTIPGLTGEEVHTGDRVIWSTAANEFQIVPGGGLTMTQGDLRYLQLIGGSLAGPGDLTIGGTLDVTGATALAGTLTLAADPLANLQAATRQYVDTRAVPTGGAVNAVLRKTAAGDYATSWTVILPPGGAAGTVPRKNTATDWDITWSTSGTVPAGGATGQVLRKTAATDYSIAWQNDVPAGGATGQILRKTAAADWSLQWANGFPTAGTLGQALTKNSATDFDFIWRTLVPTGGTVGQSLRKNSSTDFDWSWVTAIPAGGSQWQMLNKSSSTTDFAVTWVWPGMRGTSTNSSVVLGQGAMEATPSGNTKNVVIGRNALNTNTTCYDSVMIGHNLAPLHTIGSKNVCLGCDALAAWAGEDLYGTVYIGEACGRFALRGMSTIAIGRQALNNAAVTESASSIFIGAQTNAQGNAQTNQIVIGHGATGNGTNTVTLGNTSILATNGLFCRSTTIVQPSDARLKQDIEPANLDLCVEAVRKLQVSRFHWSEQFTACEDQHVTGFVAQDVERVFPKSVVSGDLEFNGTVIKDCKQTGMSEALPTLWGAVQQLIARCEDLERKLEASNGRAH